MLFRSKGKPSSERPNDAFRFSHIKEGLLHAVWLLTRTYPNASPRLQKQFDRMLSQLKRAAEPADLEEVALDLQTIDLSQSVDVTSDPVDGRALVGAIVDAILPLADAVDVPGVSVGLLRVRENMHTAGIDNSLPRRLATELEILAGAVGWLRRSAEVFRISLGDLLNVLRPLAREEDNAHDRLLLLRRRLEDAGTVEELHELRARLIEEASCLVEEARQRTSTASDIQQRIEHHETQIRVIESALTDARTLAMTDPLTGLGNEMALDDAAREAAQRTYDVGVLFIDVDHFKSINEKRSHRAGDLVLQEIARRIRVELRSRDHAFRAGGEEFVVLMSRADVAAAVTTAEHIRQQIEATPLMVEGAPLRLTVSIGCALWSGGARFPDILRAAEGAMHRAKAEGRNRVATAS